jgi:hypothetical protein
MLISFIYLFINIFISFVLRRAFLNLLVLHLGVTAGIEPAS